MIPRIHPRIEEPHPIETPADWKKALARAFRSPAELIGYLGIPSQQLPEMDTPERNEFPLLVPRSFADRMEKGNPDDPLLKQVLPSTRERQMVDGYTQDPLEERRANPVPGLLHKYGSRVLVTLTGACPVHCRYCFRRHFPYHENRTNEQHWPALLNYIARFPEINEVILSGGDPLTVGDAALERFTHQLSGLQQIRRIRLHTRFPVVIPERLCPALFRWVRALHTQGIQVILVIHMNHPNEMNAELRHGLRQLKDTGAVLLNQSVLLNTINDDAGTLTALSETLFESGVLPYYLHLPDKVSGTSHFDVDEQRGKALIQQLRSHLPGFLVPRLVREVAGQPSKTVIA